MWAALGFILAAYLLGSIPQVYLLGRLKGKDLRQEGDLHLALWHTSRPLGLVGILSDLAKGPVPVLLARYWGIEVWVWAGAGLAVVMGQMWPLFLPSSGGKGNSTAITMALALAPVPLLLALIPILFSLLLRTIARRRKNLPLVSGPPSYSLPLGMLTSFALLPVVSWRLSEPKEISLALLILFLAIVLRRLTAGVRQDLRAARSKGSVLLNRLLYDRGFL